MPIYAPGKRDKHGRLKSNGKRNIAAVLALTAMVDMFTVLVVFLLQNYKTTGEIIILNKDVELPQASETKELEPATVVVITPNAILVERQIVADTDKVKEQDSWMVDNLYISIQEYFVRKQEEQQNLQNRLNDVVKDIRNETNPKMNNFRRITLQADKNIDFLTIKKVMYTLNDAGASEIGFAVIQDEQKFDPENL